MHIQAYFNSHTREGVTKDYPRNAPVGNDFNSHTREGVTDNKEDNEMARKFQLTHP